MPELSLHSIADFQSAITQPRILLLKYSPICPISLVAQSQLKMFQLDHPAAPTMTVNVIGERAIAREIAALCGIEHESPQAILFESGSVTWHASHTAITTDSLAAAWSPKC
jgi:bacillithiol system protein YtxJ